MPSLGADMESAELVAWQVRPGDEVRRGDIVAVIETHKGAIDVEAYVSGRVARLLVEPGARVPVGAPIAVLEDGAGAAPEVEAEPAAAAQAVAVAEVEPVAEAAAEPVAEAAAEPVAVAEAAPQAAPRPADGWVRASPAARARARSLGIALEDVRGSGPGGAVTLADLEAAPSPTPTTPAPPTPATRPRPTTAGLRQAIAAAMARSNREIPHLYLTHSVDVAEPLRWLAARNAQRPVAERVLPAALFLQASARALARHPELNGYWKDDAFVPGAGVHLGVAVSLRGGGVVIPALRDADRLGLDALMQGLRDLVGRARSGRLRSSELDSGTATVTNLGDTGVESVLGVVYPPQVALIGFGRVVERPWAVDGMLTVRPVVTVSLAADHRAVDGHAGARLLSTLEQLLRQPEAP